MIEKKKSKKALIIIMITVAILLIGAGGYLVYNSYFKQEPKEAPVVEKKENTDFYAVENLVKNKYIEKIETTEGCLGECDNTNNQTVAIKDGKLYITENIYETNAKLIEAKGIVGTPKYVSFIYYQAPNSTMFVVLTEEGDLYYSNPEETESTEALKIKDFTKINNEKVVNMYGFVLDENIIYPFAPLTIYAEMENGDLLKVNEGKITTSFRDDWKYSDQICGPYMADDCIGLSITSDKKIYNSYYNDNEEAMYEEIMYNNESIIVKDAFSIVENEQSVYYYIISTDNKLYRVTSNNESQIKETKLYKETEIQDYSFEKTTTNDEDTLTAKITYKDGTTENFKNVNAFSTLYYRYNK